MNTCQISLTKNIYRILGHTFETLGNKLINTANKEENQIIINNIKDNKEKPCKEDETSVFPDNVIQPSNQHNNLIETINLILDFNEKFN